MPLLMRAVRRNPQGLTLMRCCHGEGTIAALHQLWRPPRSFLYRAAHESQSPRLWRSVRHGFGGCCAAHPVGHAGAAADGGGGGGAPRRHFGICR